MSTRFNTYDNAVPVVLIPDKTYVYNERYFTGDRTVKDVLDSAGFRCIIYTNDDHSEYPAYEVTDLVAEASWTDNLDDAAMELNLTLWDPVVQGSRDLNLISKGDRVELMMRNYGDDKPKVVTTFVIWEISKNSAADPIIELTCYDELIYLLKSEDNFLFNKKTSRSKKGWTATEITDFLCRKYGIPKGFIAKATHRIPYFRVDGGSPYDVILKAWTEERKNTDVRYLIRSENGRLTVKPKHEQREIWQIRSGENLIDISYTDSLEGMYSAVRAISPKQEGDTSTADSSSDTTNNKKKKSESYANPDGGNWYRAKAKWFVPGDDGVTCTEDYKPTTNLQGFAELPALPSDLYGNALGGLSCGQKIEVRYKNKVLVLPKVSQQNKHDSDCYMSLTKASMAKLVGADNLNKKPIIDVEWRLAGGIEDKPQITEVSGGPVNKASADVIAVHKNMVNSYGYIQKLVTAAPGLTKKNITTEAKNALNEAARENYDAELTCYFLPFLRAGDPVHVIDEGTGLNGRYYCSDVEHTLAASGSRTNVGLNWLDIVPSAEISPEEKAPPPPPTAAGQQAGGNNYSLGVGGYTPGSSGCGAEAIKFGQQYVGKVKYVLGGGSINSISGGTDCSGFTEHVWWRTAQITIGSWTGSQKNAGQAVKRGDEQMGDLLFYNDPMSERGGHVALWIDKNKVLECGGKVRPSGVGISNRNDHKFARRVSHLCRSMGRPSADDAGSAGTDPKTPSPDTKARLLTRVVVSKWLPRKWGHRTLDAGEFGDRMFWVRDDFFETQAAGIFMSSPGALAIQMANNIGSGAMVAVYPHDISQWHHWWWDDSLSNKGVDVPKSTTCVLDARVWNWLRPPASDRLPMHFPIQVTSLQGIKEFDGIPQGPLSAQQRNMLRTGNYTWKSDWRSPSGG